jgi:hypothetical protein
MKKGAATDPAIMKKIFKCLEANIPPPLARCPSCYAKLVRVVSGTFERRVFYRAVCTNSLCRAPQIVSGPALYALPLKDGTIDEFNNLVEGSFTARTIRTP